MIDNDDGLFDRRCHRFIGHVDGGQFTDNFGNRFCLTRSRTFPVRPLPLNPPLPLAYAARLLSPLLTSVAGEEYRRHGCIGTGGFSQVFVVEHRNTKQLRAISRIKKQRLLKEVQNVVMVVDLGVIIWI